MTVTYMTAPQNKLTLGATELTNELLSAKITRLENGFDSATIVLHSTSYYPTTVTQGTVVQIEVKDGSDTSYTSLFVGIARFVVADISDSNRLTISCLGIGSGLNEMLVAAEYGAQASNGLDTIAEILTDSTYGIIPKYVEKILSTATDSNYAFDTTKVETIAGTIPYISFPYKPADKCLNDLCDLVTALGDGSTAGPHWITTYAAGTNYLRVKLVSGTQTGWTKYYGNSQANATLTYGVDYTSINLEKMAAEANYIVYYGAWRRPSSGDTWTQATTSWSATAGALATDTDEKIVGTVAVKAKDTTNPTGEIQVKYPSSDAGWDFSKFTEFNTPNLNFYTFYDLTHDTHLIVKLCKDGTDFYQATVTKEDGSAQEYLIPPNQQWQHYTIPVGPYFNSQNNLMTWTAHGSIAGWSEINYIEFYVADAELYDSVNDRYFFLIDGLHFGGAAVCRVAALSDYTGVIVRQRLIVDDVGKDDSLVATDDSGLMAQMAYSELLRGRSEATVGTVETPMIKDLLPGQWLYIQSADYRVTKIIHTIDTTGYHSLLYVTSDVLNSRARLRYEDVNKQFASIRPEWQDRQASNIKAANVDFRVAPLIKTYT